MPAGYKTVIKLPVMLLACGMIPLLEGQHPHARAEVVTFHGILKNLTNKEILIESGENKLLTLRYSRRTKFHSRDGEIKPADIDLESRVAVDAVEDTDLKLLATDVWVESAPQKAPHTRQPKLTDAEPMLYCPRCNARLTELKCKLICERCGYYMSCADYV